MNIKRNSGFNGLGFFSTINTTLLFALPLSINLVCINAQKNGENYHEKVEVIDQNVRHQPNHHFSSTYTRNDQKSTTGLDRISHDPVIYRVKENNINNYNHHHAHSDFQQSSSSTNAADQSSSLADRHDGVRYVIRGDGQNFQNISTFERTSYTPYNNGETYNRAASFEELEGFDDDTFLVSNRDNNSLVNDRPRSSTRFYTQRFNQSRNHRPASSGQQWKNLNIGSINSNIHGFQSSKRDQSDISRLSNSPESFGTITEIHEDFPLNRSSTQHYPTNFVISPSSDSSSSRFNHIETVTSDNVNFERNTSGNSHLYNISEYDRNSERTGHYDDWNYVGVVNLPNNTASSYHQGVHHNYSSYVNPFNRTRHFPTVGYVHPGIGNVILVDRDDRHESAHQPNRTSFQTVANGTLVNHTLHATRPDHRAPVSLDLNDDIYNHSRFNSSEFAEGNRILSVDGHAVRLGPQDRLIVGDADRIRLGHQNRIAIGNLNRTILSPYSIATGYLNRTDGYHNYSSGSFAEHGDSHSRIGHLNASQPSLGTDWTSHIYRPSYRYNQEIPANRTIQPDTSFSSLNNGILNSPVRTRIEETNRIDNAQVRPVVGTGSAVVYDSREGVNIENRFSSENIIAADDGAEIAKEKKLSNSEVEALNIARIVSDKEKEDLEKKSALNVAKLAATDQLESEIITNMTRAYLSCESGEMIVKINFTEPFRGVGYADYDRSSPCKFYGDGKKYYEMRLPLKGCGTKQEAPRIFINNIILRFHRSLELEEDEIKTIICRYPPPLAPPPPLIAAPILEQPPIPAPFHPAKLSEVELLLIVSALLFLTLLLLGIGIGYYCLKKRKVKVVRKFVPPAEIPYFPPPSISSEEHSIISEGSIVHRDDYQFQNLGFIPEAKLTYADDVFYHDQDYIDDDIIESNQNVIVPPVPFYKTKKFDDRFVTNASENDVDDELEVNQLIVPKKPKITKITTDQYFVTPKTTTEIVDEVTTHRVIVPKKNLTTKKIDDTYITPQEENRIEDEVITQRAFVPKTISSEQVDHYIHSESEIEMLDDTNETKIIASRPNVSIENTDDHYRTDLYEIDEIIEDEKDFKYVPSPSPTTRIVQTTEDDEIITKTRDVEEFVDDSNYRLIKQKPSRPPRKPKITVKNIDDFYVTNITETETNEHVTKIGRSMPNLALQIEEYESKEEIEDRDIRMTQFDVRVRSIPVNRTDTLRKTNIENTMKIEEVLRVLENPPREKLPKIDEHLMLPTRNRLRNIIIKDEVFRTLIIESTTIEEYYEKIQCHPTYGPMFEPPTWDVIFRLFSLPEVQKLPKGKYSDTFRSAVSSHEARSVTEEDVTFSRSRSSYIRENVPPPDYAIDDDIEYRSRTDHWASNLPDPKRFHKYSPDQPPIQPAFGTTRRIYQPKSTPASSKPSSLFGDRHLANPYGEPLTARNRLFDYDIRPYSPDLDALSLEPSQSYLSYSGSFRRRDHQIKSEEREEIKSTTETNVYDWKFQ
ncbi:exosome component 10 [Sarcoptes scabiei]|nr:exosome component 10 [Sarcoptes scabiei]